MKKTNKPNTTYWAVLLSEKSKQKLLEQHKPYHPNVFAEHMTIIFNPTTEEDEIFMKQLGWSSQLVVTGVRTDDRGQAVVVTGQRRPNGGIPHITISCANKTKPFYSNKLLDGGWNFSEPLTLYGVIARYTKNGWDKGTGASDV